MIKISRNDNDSNNINLIITIKKTSHYIENMLLKL